MSGVVSGQKKRDPALFGAVFLLGLLSLAALLAPLLAPHDPMRQMLLMRLKPPGFSPGGGAPFLFGSDELGRDILSRTVFSLRLSLLVALSSSGLSAILGVFVGLVAGWRGGGVDRLAMRLADVVLSVPTLILAIFAIAVIGPGVATLIGVLAFARWPRHARLARAETLRLREKSYVQAARLAGAGTGRILVRHILPNAAGPLIVLVAAEVGLMVLFEAGLTFLGLGIAPPQPALGAMLGSGRLYLDSAWWMTVFPGLAIFCLVLALTILSDRLRDRLDPARAAG